MTSFSTNQLVVLVKVLLRCSELISPNARIDVLQTCQVIGGVIWTHSHCTGHLAVLCSIDIKLPSHLRLCAQSHWSLISGSTSPNQIIVSD